MKVLAVVAVIYCALLTIYCTHVVIDYYKEYGFDLEVFLLWVILIACTGGCIYFALS